MPNPFPGMNPYLEQPDFWSDFHNQLVAALARALVPRLLPKYRVVTDKWVYTVTDTMTLALGRPDVSIQQRKLDESSVATVVQRPVQPVPVRVPMPLEIQQAYLEVKDAATQEVVTVVEVLSPANKTGEGRSQYQAKRERILGGLTNLVEIDLLRAGPPFLLEIDAIQSHYRILVSRSQSRPMADLYPFNLTDPIPPFPLPLRAEDGEVLVDTQALLEVLYEQLGYDYFIDYQSPPPSPWVMSDIQSVLQA
jgi:hypothetical protein